jgi:hypothetical protein
MPPFIYTDKAPSKLHPDNPVRNVYIMSFQDRYGKDECLALKAVSIIDAENNKRYRTFKYNNFFIPNPGTTFSYTFGTANGDMSAAYRPLIIRWKIDKECKR